MTRSTRMLGWILFFGVSGLSTTSRGAINMPDSTISICTGRFAVSLPADAKPAIDATYHHIQTKINAQMEDFQSLKNKIKKIEEKYATSEMQRSSRDDAMERAAGFNPDKTYGKVQLVGFSSDEANQQIILGYHPKTDSTEIITNIYKIVNGHQYVFTSRDAGADDYATTSSAMLSATASFKSLQQGIVPTTPGFCVDGGMFADVGHPSAKESFTLVVHFKDHPDAQFTIDASAIDSPDKDEPSLKFRVDSELGILRQNVEGHVAVLERGEHEAAGQKGYQIGLSVPNDTVPGTTAYKFFWAADGVPNDVTRPYMEVQLTIQPDEHKPATIKTPDEAKALWDELLGGIRIRPGAARL